MRLARHTVVDLPPEPDLRLLDDAAVMTKTPIMDASGEAPVTCRHEPAEAASTDPQVLRAALRRESAERCRAECLARMQTEIVQLALDSLVQQPDVEGFFGALTKTMVDEGESFACGVWLIDESGSRSEL